MTLLAGQHCPLCSHDNWLSTFIVEPLILQCMKHNVLLSWLWESELSYEEYYSDVAQFHTATQIEEGFPSSVDRHREHLAASQSRMAIYIELIGKDKFFLDVGAGTGAFVEEATCFWWQGSGIDSCRTIALERGLLYGSWSDVEKIQCYDVITLHDVLEHLTRPQECLMHLKECLAPGGSLVVEMPLWENQGTEWRHIRPKQHICLYSKEAFEELASRCGLKVQAFWKPCDGKLDKGVWILKAS